jgi:hypothetical protein
VLHVCCQKLCSEQEKMAVLSQGVGYGVVLGVGALFAGMANLTLSYPPFSPA